MKVLITGASGFIGQNLVRALGKHTVYGLFRNAEKSRQFKSVLPLVGDLTDRESLRHALEGHDFDMVYHLAAVPVFEKNKDLQRRVNIDGTKNLAESIGRSSLKLFVYASGLGVYGDVKGGWVDENAPTAPHTFYTKTRLEAEQFLKSSGLPLVVVRFGEVYGNGGWFTDTIVNRLKHRNFRVPGDGSYYRSFVHVNDVVHALELIGDKKLANETLIIVDNEPATFREFVDLAADKIGVPHPGKIPAFLASVAVGGELIKLLTVSIKARNAKVKQLLGWEPRYPTFREGLGRLDLR